MDAISAKHEAERVEAELSNMRRERLLSEEKTLEKGSRYEAHLSRLLFKSPAVRLAGAVGSAN